MESDLVQLGSPTEEKEPSPDSSILPNPDIGQKKPELEAECRDSMEVGEVTCPPSAMGQAPVGSTIKDVEQRMESDLTQLGSPTEDKEPSPDSLLLPKPAIGLKKPEPEAEWRDSIEEGNGSVVFSDEDIQRGVEIGEVTCPPNAMGQAPVEERGDLPLDEMTVMIDEMAQISIKQDKGNEQTVESDLAQLGSPTEGKEPSPGSLDLPKPEIGLKEPELEEDWRDSVEEWEDYVELPDEVNQWGVEIGEVTWQQDEDYEQSPDPSLLPNPEFGLYEPVLDADWRDLIEDWGNDVELPEGVNQWGVEIGGATWPLSDMGQAPVSERGSSPHELTVMEEKTAQISIEQDEGNEQGMKSDLAQLGNPTEEKEPTPDSSALPKPEIGLNELELEADGGDSIGERNGTVVLSDEDIQRGVEIGEVACPPNAMGQAPVGEHGGPLYEMTAMKDDIAQISIKQDKGNEQKMESDLAQLGSPTEGKERSSDSSDLPNPEFYLYEPELEVYWRVSTEDWDNYVEMPEGVNQWGVEIGGVTMPLSDIGQAPVSERRCSPHELTVTEDEMTQISIMQDEGNAQGMSNLAQLGSPTGQKKPSPESSALPKPEIGQNEPKLEADGRDSIGAGNGIIVLSDEDIQQEVEIGDFACPPNAMGQAQSSASSVLPKPEISQKLTKLEAECRDLIQSFSRNESASSSRASGSTGRHGGPVGGAAGYTTWTLTPRSTYSPIPMSYDEFALLGHRPLTEAEIARMNPSKMARMRSRLCAFLHAIRCLYREIIGLEDRCDFIWCISKRETLRHTMRCQNLVDCRFPRCVKVSRLLHHYTLCGKPSCPLCNSFINRSPTFCCCMKPHPT